MEKFYWEPNRDDRIGIISGIFGPDGLTSKEIEQLVERYDGQSIDFFGALRSRIYDEQILAFIENVGFDKVGSNVVNSEEKPTFRKPDFSLEHLFEQGDLMVKEQRRLQELRLAAAYNRALSESESIPTQEPVSVSAKHSVSGNGLSNGSARNQTVQFREKPSSTTSLMT